MPEDQSGLYQAGETLLLVKVPEAEPLVGGWRRRFDSSAGARLPAHVTVLYPFLDHGRIDADVLGALELLVGAHGAFDIRFECFGRFPDVLFLVPTPGVRCGLLLKPSANDGRRSRPMGAGSSRSSRT